MIDQRLVSLSALQHYAFCPRQCALIHIEQVWAENFLTAHGQQLHQRVDSKEPETRKGVRYERGVAVSASKLGLIGKLDLIEVELATGQYCPVEYKRGKPKKNDWDHIQLCAQGLCLEEMLNTPVSQGYMWYWQTRNRELVVFSDELRNQTCTVINQVKDMFESGVTPKAIYEKKKCQSCSLYDLCNPKIMEKDFSNCYIQELFDSTGNIDEEATE